MTVESSPAAASAMRGPRHRHARQYRICQLQVINWGPFDGLHTYPFPDDGVLITGQSGTGKSTLQDAISTLLFPTGRQGYNASAAEGEFGGRDGDRDLAGYVRGVYGSESDGTSKYLRGGGPTWSAIGCTWRNGEGRVITAVAMFHYADAAIDTASAVKTYTIHERTFDIAELEQLYAQNNFRRDRVKAVYPEPVSHYPRSFGDYQATLMRLLGIRSEAGMSLLARAKAAKNIGSLDGFVRGSMLERPTTFTIADRLCSDFAEIDQLYKTVIDQKTRADYLAAIPDLYRRYCDAEVVQDDAQRLLGGPLEAYLLQLRLRLTDERLDELEREQHRLGELVTEHDRIIKSKEDAAERLADQIRDMDGGAYQRLEQDHSAAEQALESTSRRHRRFGELCAKADFPAPTTLAEYQALRIHAASELAQTLTLLPDATATANAASAEFSEAKKRLGQVATELASLASRRSLIPAYQNNIRLQISEATGIPVDDMPYAAELIDIKADQRKWQLAAERVLRGFGLNLLVRHRHIQVVKTYVNDHDMRGRVTLQEVPTEPERRVQPRDRDTLLSKLEFADHPMANWLWNRIANGYAAVCVAHPGELQRHHHAVTAQGLEHQRGRYTKNDDPRYSQRTSWILGFDNHTKIAAFEQEHDQLRLEAAAKDEVAEEATKARDRLRDRQGVLQQIEDGPAWDDIDVHTCTQTLERLVALLEAAKLGNQRLVQMQARLEADRSALNLLRTARARDAVLAEQANTAGNHLLEQRQKASSQLDQATPLTGEDRALLDPRFERRHPTLEGLGELRQLVEKEIREAIAEARSARDNARLTMEKTFTGYLTTWPDEAVNLKDSVDYAPEYVARYQDIMHKGLPQRQEQFRTRLDNDAVERLVLLLHAIDDERKQIRRRIDQVNASLATTVYNTTDGGTYLTIDYTESPTADARAFRTHVTQAFPELGTTPDDRQRKRQFDMLRAIIHKFTSAEDRRWKENVLDVRKAFEFHGKEVNAAGDTVRSWWNTNSNSGGEQEKIVAFCLAAALSYQLKSDTEQHPTFGSIMLDEAFSKSDETFTDQAMSAFIAFGFQLVLAAPVRMAPILEPYLGGLMLVKKFEDPATRRISSEGFYLALGELVAEFGGDVSEVD